ncbi:hypothetical protein Pint_14461 [Pistacia integerrima]|uniref:Uncharacterized protein n=1 Tax=Pistacia integerrima TaxID=434235 RepID=A0ACC0Y988_9ROSI|nr:hypothetical protein Pint_14461 [Pistacia integerrima]
MEAIVVVIILLMPLRVLNIGKNYQRELDNLTVGKTAEHRMLYFYRDWWWLTNEETIGRILEKLGLELTPINTKGYETLLKLRLDLAFESLKKQLLGRAHAETFLDMREKPTAPKLPQNGTAHESSLETQKNYAGK